jgi:hypothetical protein
VNEIVEDLPTSLVGQHLGEFVHVEFAQVGFVFQSPSP